MIPVNRPVISDTDIEAVSRTLRDTWVSGESPAVEEFESALCQETGASRAVAVATGTSACDLATEALGVNSSSTVIAPATTIISTVSHAARLGAKIRVVDVDHDTWCIDTAQVEANLGPEVSAIYAVHLYGLAADMDAILSLADHASAAVIEDAAEALGQQYNGRSCGSLGTAGVFSFYANKVVTSGEGGAVVTSSDEVAEEVRRLRNLYFSSNERFVHERLGFNARMSGVTAALAAAQMARLADLKKRKRLIGERYQANLEGHPWLRLPPSRTSQTTNSYWVFPLLVEPWSPSELPAVRQTLFERGVDTRRLFYPLNQQPALRRLGLLEGPATPVADRLWDTGFYVPSGVGTTDEEIDYVSDVLWDMAR